METVRRTKISDLLQNGQFGTTVSVKGWVRTHRGNKQVSCVGEIIDISDWNEDMEETRLVVISSVGIKMLSEILKASGEHVDSGLKL